MLPHVGERALYQKNKKQFSQRGFRGRTVDAVAEERLVEGEVNEGLGQLEQPHLEELRSHVYVEAAEVDSGAYNSLQETTG